VQAAERAQAQLNSLVAAFDEASTLPGPVPDGQR
jgi:hypothetical protein